MQVFDFIYNKALVQGNEGVYRGFREQKEQDEIRVVSLRDDELLIDQSRFFDENMRQTEIKYASYTDNSIRAFGFNWPYVSFAGLENYVIIINCFDRKLIHRVQIA